MRYLHQPYAYLLTTTSPVVNRVIVHANTHRQEEQHDSLHVLYVEECEGSENVTSSGQVYI